jgi:hypothetical protein
MLALLVLLLVQPARSDTPTLQPHPALAQHSSALARIAASSDEPLAERQRLWSSLRGHAQRRGSQAAAELGGAVAGLGLKAAQGLPTHVSRQRTVTPPGLDAGDIDPVSFGADPTGIRDSTEAMARAVQELLHGGVRRRSTLSSNITDLAGACLNLGGGEYLLSAPIIIPQFFGNFEISGGTLRASKTFPSSAHLITIGAAPCNPDYAASCNEFIGLSNLLLDASHTAAGAIRIISAMGVTVGPAVFVERFTQTGIRIDGGHETLIHESWFVETYWSNLPPAPPPPPGPGTPVMARCDGSQAQRWELIAGGAKKQLDAALPGSLVSAASGQCFDVDGCDTPTVGTGVLMWSCNSAYPGNNCNSTNQLWTFEPRTGQLTTTMNSGHGHLCLEAAPRLQLAQCDTSNPDQAWTLHSNATLTNAGQGADQCLSIPTPSPSPTPPAPGPAAPALNNHSIAVQINGNDHYIVDSIIWQYTNLGVEINGAANLLQGVHAWGSGCGRFTYVRDRSLQPVPISPPCQCFRMCACQDNDAARVDADAVLLGHSSLESR